MYEELLKDLQSAGNAGEFYTPGPLTDFTVEHPEPKLGKTMGVLAAGTGCFYYLYFELFGRTKDFGQRRRGLPEPLKGGEALHFQDIYLAETGFDIYDDVVTVLIFQLEGHYNDK